MQSILNWYNGPYGYYEGYSWRDRDEPCKPAYYSSRKFIHRNVLASNLGIVAKGSETKEYVVAVSDLRTTQPVASATLDFYDYQQQLLKTAVTDGEGIATVNFETTEPFVVVAKSGGEQGYLRLKDYNALSLSRFDVAGTVTQEGLKGYLYAERGVWRPGDSIFLNFVLEDASETLPKQHPVTLELSDPKGKVQQRISSLEGVNNVYAFHMQTPSDAPTGNWMAKVHVGGATFTKTLKVETVKPNRLKINMDFGKEELTAADKVIEGDLYVRWLHGAPARNLDAKVEMQLNAINTVFDEYKEYEFDDPARHFDQEPVVIFEGKVDKEGKANVRAKVAGSQQAPGKLKASFRTRAVEKGGDFSTDNFSMTYNPYDAYAGIFIPENKYNQKRFDIDKKEKVDLIVVDANGKPLANRKLHVGMYRVNWRWWWDRGENEIYKYNTSNHFNTEDKGYVTTNNRGEATWPVEVDNWGRYMVRVCDTESGHCTGDMFYAGYPWYDEDGGQNREAAAMLAFSANKDTYEVGEEIEINVPTGGIGRCLISLESGSEVLETYWRDAKAGDNTFRFYATPEMAPTVYAHVTLIQPHAQAKNDLPIRMYGVIPLSVEDVKTRLQPTLKIADKLEPEKRFTVEVAEKKGKPMAYTLAIVDEGLLDLTRFKTPNPWDAFYAKEALSVKTWDVYDHVLGAYGGELERILSIGGDGEAVGKKPTEKANRFDPVVLHAGPFYLEKGKKVKHEFTMPNYVGSVRAMVVACDNGAYGNTEKTVPVKKPLMVLATLPRVLGPGETLQLPVNVFAMEDKVKNVQVSVEEMSGLARIEGGNSRTMQFAKPGDDVAYFNIKMGDRVGIAKFKVQANGAGYTSAQEIEIDVRNPNPIVTDVADKVLEGGEKWSHGFEPLGVTGTNSGLLEVSNIPPINLGRHLRWLLRYPHGCIEQTTSSGFPQLFAGNLLHLDEEQKAKATGNIEATIDRLNAFQTASGGFAYWPGQTENSMWGSNYAGHFLLEAKAAGYSVSQNVLNQWAKYQKKAARNWEDNSARYYNDQLIQSYRLYTLALAGKAEIGAMNRLREHKKLSNTAKWRLAAAYALIGKTEVAQQLANSAGTEVENYRELSYSYGSPLRDHAMILETLHLLKEKDKAGDMVRRMAKQLSSDTWYSTQTLAYSLLAISKYVGAKQLGKQFTFTYTLGSGKSVDAGSDHPVFHIDVPIDGSSDYSFTLANTTDNMLFARFIRTGQPLIGDQTIAAENLKLEVKYKDMNGKELNVSELAQGTDFVAEVTVSNPGSLGINYEEMALSQIFPSGWEILNVRMTELNSVQSATPEYQDIRDDRIYTYFDIRKNNKQTYRYQLNAAYQGRYYLPSVYCEAMYDASINARQPGQWVQVVKAEEM